MLERSAREGILSLVDPLLGKTGRSKDWSLRSIKYILLAASAAFCISANAQISPEFHAGRRAALRALMGDSSICFVPAYPEKVKSNDIGYKYHPSPDLYYYSGIRQPNSLLILFSSPVELYDGSLINEVAFISRPDSMDAIWHGRSMGLDDVRELGVKSVYYTDEFMEFQLPMEDYKVVYTPERPNDIADNPRNKGDLYSVWKHIYKKAARDSVPVDPVKFKEMTARLRQTKLPEEVGLVQQAIDITCQAQTRLMEDVLPGMTEAQAQAIVEFEFLYNGGQGPAFPSIMGSGPNSCVLHYTTNDRTMMWDDLLLVDVGAQYNLYAADVTRTIPIDGEFSEEERAVYQLVLRAQKAGIAKTVEGERFWASGDVAKDIIAQGLVDLGVTQEYRDYQQYFMHGVSHYLGLDVHDVGLYGDLKSGQIVTVEPGVYIAPGAPCDPKWWGIGVRIEDDVLVTESGPKVMSACVVKEIAEIEKLMKKAATNSKRHKH